MQDSNNKVSLGCGTLILIALIVMFFSNSGDDNEQLTREIREVRKKISHLESEINITVDLEELKAESKKQSATLKQIQQALEKLTPNPTPEAPLPTN